MAKEMSRLNEKMNQQKSSPNKLVPTLLFQHNLFSKKYLARKKLFEIMRAYWKPVSVHTSAFFKKSSFLDNQGDRKKNRYYQNIWKKNHRLTVDKYLIKIPSRFCSHYKLSMTTKS